VEARRGVGRKKVVRRERARLGAGMEMMEEAGMWRRPMRKVKGG
jgi:hypothetical protein